VAKYEVLKDCYGFRNSFYEKGQIVEADPKENPPKHFKLLDGKSSAAPAQEASGQQEPANAAEAARLELVDEAKSRGIKDAEVLNNDELLEVLAKDISQQKIKAIVKKAKERQKK
jgi:hypothetical protein